MLNIPKIIYIYGIVYFLMHGVSIGYLGTAIQAHSQNMQFVPLQLSAGGSFDELATLLTYSVLHGSFSHLLLNYLWFVVFGTVVAREVNTFQFIMMTCVFSCIAAVAYYALHYDSHIPMIGSSGVVSGLMGASLYNLPHKIWHKSSISIANHNYTQTLWQLLTTHHIQQFIVIFHAINVVMAYFPALFGAEGGIAWEAHLAGFWAGIAIMPLFQMRQRNRA